jgi:transcriptional regulator with XRE-family HTH domain
MAMPTDVVSPTSKAPDSESAEPAGPQGPQMHRIRTVRLQQGASLRSVARKSGMDVRQLRLQEQESTDVRLSDLHKWHRALDVPLSELIEEPDSSLSRPVMERARMVRLMKTAVAIEQRSNSVSIQRMAHMLIEQLIEVMPELEDVNPWHEFGQRRGLDEYGRIVDHTVSDELIRPGGNE